jgi:hypothetical protein
MRKLSGDTLVLERMQYLNQTPQKGDVVDHIVPLSLGGDNSVGNLRYISKEANDAKAKLETKLARQIKNGEISMQEARQQVADWVKTYDPATTPTTTPKKKSTIKVFGTEKTSTTKKTSTKKAAKAPKITIAKLSTPKVPTIKLKKFAPPKINIKRKRLTLPKTSSIMRIKV